VVGYEGKEVQIEATSPTAGMKKVPGNAQGMKRDIEQRL
jgi:hypothetical protein